ncbi:MAG: hypothetical protein JXA71_04285 [Chitinispirillaceae bacterium]|nr:hypothetical protein [Chitinispirillaceae bacterium]
MTLVWVVPGVRTVVGFCMMEVYHSKWYYISIMMRIPVLSPFPLWMAWALMVALPLLCDLCRLPSLHQAVSPFPGIAWAGEQDPFAESPGQVRADLDGSFKNAEISLAEEDFRSVRRHLSLITLKIDKHKRELSRAEKKNYKNRLTALKGSVKGKTDSLVNVNIAIVEKGGQRAGYDFRQMLAAQKGLSETDLAPVDQAIVERGTYEGNEAGHAETQPPAVEPSTPTAQPSPSPVQESVRPEVPAREPEPVPLHADYPVIAPDTAAAAIIGRDEAGQAERERGEPPAATAPLSEPAGSDKEEEKNRVLALERAAKARSLLDAGKVEEAAIVFRIYQQQIKLYADPAGYESLKAAVDAASIKDQQQRTRAAQKAKSIERLLDQNRIAEAFAEMNKSRDLLKQHLEKGAYKALEKSVGQAYIGFIRKQLSANETMQTLRGMLAQKDVEKANAAFEAHRAELIAGLSREAFEGLRKDIAAAYSVIVDQKKQSEYLCRNIASSIKAGNGAAAGELFDGNRLLLERHLDEGRFSALAANVDKARRNFMLRREKARSMAASIDSLLKNSRVEEAYALFDDMKKRLKTDLADDKRFFELKDRLSAAHADLRSRQRAAARTSQEIEYLMRLREGQKAYDLFRQEEPLLRQYCARDAFGSLKNAAVRASADYTLRRGAAQMTATSIAALMDQNKVEEAYADYRKVKDDFDFYLEGDPSIEALGKRVIASYKALQVRKQWASEQVKQIRRLIEKRKGNHAYAQFKKMRPELANYCDPKTLDALATVTDRANREFEEAAGRAREQAARILALLDRDNAEEAYDAFNAAGADLRFYLDAPEYESLAKRVEASNSALQGKKKDALHIIKTMDKLINRNRGDSAYQTFRQNDSFLAVYLGSSTYKKAGARAAAAKTDFEKKCGSAQTLEKKLYAQINRDRVLDAYETFRKRRDYLETYLDRSRFVRLKTAVTVSYDAFMAERKKARALVTALMRMIRKRQAVEAKAEFNRCEQTLARYLPSDEYREIVANVSKGYNSTLRGREEAEEATDAIRQLLEKDEIAYAYATFREMRPTLEQFTSHDRFTALETEVSYAWGEREKKVKHAREYAKELKQLVSKKRTSDAYKRFRQHRQALAKYLDSQSFSDLESMIVDAYKKRS